MKVIKYTKTTEYKIPVKEYYRYCSKSRNLDFSVIKKLFKELSDNELACMSIDGEDFSDNVEIIEEE